MPGPSTVASPPPVPLVCCSSWCHRCGYLHKSGKKMLDEQVAAPCTHTGVMVSTNKYSVRATRGCCASLCVTVAIAKDKDPSIIITALPSHNTHNSWRKQGRDFKINPTFVYTFRWWQQGHFICNDLFPWLVAFPTSKKSLVSHLFILPSFSCSPLYPCSSQLVLHCWELPRWGAPSTPPHGLRHMQHVRLLGRKEKA